MFDNYDSETIIGFHVSELRGLLLDQMDIEGRVPHVKRIKRGFPHLRYAPTKSVPPRHG